MGRSRENPVSVRGYTASRLIQLLLRSEKLRERRTTPSWMISLVNYQHHSTAQNGANKSSNCIPQLEVWVKSIELSLCFISRNLVTRRSQKFWASPKTMWVLN